MSTKQVAAEIRRFLSSTEPEVICVTGRWGVGKTFAWRYYLKEAQSTKAIALPRYSYVSLFGLNSLEEFKYSIFENSVQSSNVEGEASIETLRTNTSAVAERMGRKFFGIVQQAAFTKNYFAGLAPTLFLSVRGTIICVDDIERRGGGLSIRDVFGLVSALREQKRCKIVLILNDEALREDLDEFQKYFEKVVDTKLTFAPTAEECVQIALPQNDKPNKLLGTACVDLKISNIRLIKKIDRLIRRVEPMLASFDEQVLTQAIRSLALLAWSTYDPQNAPPIEYIKRRQSDALGLTRDKELAKDEGAWNALLDAYGFSGIDEFDAALLDGIRDGFFDSESIETHGSQLNEKIKVSGLQGSFFSAWEMFHDSFANNETEVLDAIYSSAIKGIKYVNPINLSGTVTLLKELGRPEQAAEVIQHYVASRSDREAFNLNHYPFREDVRDPDVVRAFEDKHKAFPDTKSPLSILQAMARMNGWNPDDITTLAQVSVDEYYKIFKGAQGHDLHRILDTCLQFDRIGNASPEMLEISRRGKDALRRIGAESLINAKRVKRYGVDVSKTGSSDPNANHAEES